MKDAKRIVMKDAKRMKDAPPTVNIFNGEAPPTVVVSRSVAVVVSRSVAVAEWKLILGNAVGDEVRSRAWCKRALLRIYANQELDEQAAANVTKRNGVGFTPADAKLLTSLAKQMIERSWLSAKQWEILYKLMPKYARQLQRSVR